MRLGVGAHASFGGLLWWCEHFDRQSKQILSEELFMCTIDPLLSIALNCEGAHTSACRNGRAGRGITVIVWYGSGRGITVILVWQWSRYHSDCVV